MSAGMRYQPQGRIEIDGGNPLAANLEFLYVGSTPIEAVKNRIATPIGVPAYRGGVGGKSFAFDGSSRALVFQRDSRLEIASGFTVWAYVYIPSYTAAAANNDFFCKAFANNASAPFLSWSLGNGSSSGSSASTAIKAAIGIGSSLFTAEMTCSVGLNLIGLTYDGANLRGWIGGVNKATTAATGSVNYDTSSAGNLIIGGASGASITKDFRGDIYAAGFNSRVFAQADFARLADNPWQLVTSPADRQLVASAAAGGGTVTEAASASDASDAIIIRSASIAEAAAAADSFAAVATYFASLAEVAAAAESSGAALTSSASSADALAATDAQSTGGATTSASITEAATASDTASALLTGSASIAEAASATATATASQISTAAISEAASAVDATAFVGNTFAASVSEAASAADTQSVQAMLAATIAEAGAASDLTIASLIGAAAITETSAAIDITTGTIVGEVVYARAPRGSGYTSQSFENQTRPSSGSQTRPANTQRNNR